MALPTSPTTPPLFVADDETSWAWHPWSYFAALPNPAVPAYTELNARLGWAVTPKIQVSVSGFNLLHAYHLEYPSSEGGAVPRSVFVELRVKL